MATAPVNLVLLRALVPDLPVRAGDVLPARVISRDGAGGLLYLAGVRVPAQLPAELAAGTRLRLLVQETTGEKLVLRVVPEAEAPAAQQAPAPTADPLAGALRAGLVVTLPGGAVARLFVDPEQEGESEGTRSSRGLSRVTLRFEAAALGRIDLALETLGGVVSGTVHAPAGEAAARLTEHVDELRAALARATGRPASVTVRQRGETVDLRA